MSEHDPTMPVGEALRRVLKLREARLVDARISPHAQDDADAIAVLLRVVDQSSMAVLAWDCLQSYKGDEMHKPIDAFRAAIGALRQALASGPGPQQEKS